MYSGLFIIFIPYVRARLAVRYNFRSVYILLFLPILAFLEVSYIYFSVLHFLHLAQYPARYCTNIALNIAQYISKSGRKS